MRRDELPLLEAYANSKVNEVLEKIRAEVEELKPNNPNFKGYYEQNVALNKVLELLDQHKAECERDDGNDN